MTDKGIVMSLFAKFFTIILCEVISGSILEGLVLTGTGGWSLDQYLEVLPNSFLRLLCIQIEYGVIWRYPHSPPEDIPDNIRLLTWLPQQDLLSHPRTRLFITHCGANGQFEALYHAVPMIGVPLFAEQHYNARRAQYHHYGETIDIFNFTSDHMISVINHVISDPSYHDSIGRGSGIFRNAQMAPQERAAWWIEHVIQHDGKHLRAHALDMPWYQYLMVDIFLFVFLNVSLALFILFKIFSLCVKLIRGMNSDHVNNNSTGSLKKGRKNRTRSRSGGKILCFIHTKLILNKFALDCPIDWLQTVGSNGCHPIFLQSDWTVGSKLFGVNEQLEVPTD